MNTVQVTWMPITILSPSNSLTLNPPHRQKLSMHRKGRIIYDFQGRTDTQTLINDVEMNAWPRLLSRPLDETTVIGKLRTNVHNGKRVKYSVKAKPIKGCAESAKILPMLSLVFQIYWIQIKGLKHLNSMFLRF